MKRLFAALIVTIGILGISAEARPQPERTVTVRIGQERSAGRGNVRIKFLEMIEDSRCPRDVQCIQAGNASIRVRVSRNRHSEVLVLNTNGRAEKAVFAGYVFTLTRLTPEPRSNIRVNRNGYVATISVTRA